jgi:hypothetical protein
LASGAEEPHDKPLGRLQERYRLEAGYLKAFPAADISATDEVVLPHHVRLRLGKARAIALVCMPGQLRFSRPYQPANLIFVGLPAVRTSKSMRTYFGFFVEKVTFFHGPNSFSELQTKYFTSSRREMLI